MKTATLLTRNGSHSTATHQCPTCAKALPTANGLKIHIGRVHGSIKPWRAKRGATRSYRPRLDFVEKVLERHAPRPAALPCTCGYDLAQLIGNTSESNYCPGCGKTIQTLIDQYSALLRP